MSVYSTPTVGALPLTEDAEQADEEWSLKLEKKGSLFSFLWSPVLTGLGCPERKQAPWLFSEAKSPWLSPRVPPGLLLLLDLFVVTPEKSWHLARLREAVGTRSQANWRWVVWPWITHMTSMFTNFSFVCDAVSWGIPIPLPLDLNVRDILTEIFSTYHH